MNTEIFCGNLEKAAEILKNGGLVAVPTETVYGLAGNGLDKDAVNRIYEVKGRPTIKPLSLMVAGKESIEQYCLNIPQQAYTLAEKFWPGPLTIVLPAKDNIPPIVLAGGNTVGLRCPAHPMTLELLKLSGIPFAAPSANPSNEKSPKTAGEVSDYFNGEIEGIVDGGPCGIGVESTIISMTSIPYKILRKGALEEREIAAALAEKMKIIGITGGSGCGKTTALEVCEKLGAAVVDCDKLYHEMLETDSSMIGELAERFPSASDGGINRSKLREIVYSDTNALNDLNSITHKHIIRRLKELSIEFAMQGKTAMAIDALYIADSPISEMCSEIIGVIADKEIRIQRIIARDNISEDAANKRISVQKDDSFYRENCSRIIGNNGSYAEFYEKCNTVLKEIFE